MRMSLRNNIVAIAAETTTISMSIINNKIDSAAQISRLLCYIRAFSETNVWTSENNINLLYTNLKEMKAINENTY